MAGTTAFYLSSNFNNESYKFFTRGSMYDLDVPMPNRDIFRQSIVHQDAVPWNAFDNPIKCCNSISVYRLLNTCIKLAHACNVHIVLLVKLFKNVILVYWAPRWNPC